MQKEFSKTKILIATVVGIAFLAMVALFIIAIIRKPVGGAQDVSKQEVIPAATIDQNQTANDKQKDVKPEDEIKFEDPGNDEVGNEIKELDSLINDALPSEYNESDLSDDLVNGNIELQ